MKLSNYHTHTVFCDGRDTPEALVLEAISLGCPEIGFSGHSYLAFDEEYCMSKKATKEYVKTVESLKEKYDGRIKILLGIEQDFFSPYPTEAYDYVIGSVHYVHKAGNYLSVDESREKQMALVKEYYDGDFYSFAADYFETVSKVFDKTGCDIIGHFDLITKFNEGNVLFDTSHPRYRQAAESALDVLLKTPAVFEVNTGAISRGYRTASYPEKCWLDKILGSGKKVILTSDCHAKENLLFGLSELKEQLKENAMNTIHI